MAEPKLKPAVFAFLKAAESGDDQAVLKYLDDGGDVHASDDGYNTALHLVNGLLVLDSPHHGYGIGSCAGLLSRSQASG